jgi:hypothetical protein
MVAQGNGDLEQPPANANDRDIGRPQVLTASIDDP